MNTIAIADDADWQAVLARRAGVTSPRAGSGLDDLYAPLCRPADGRSFVVGHLAQSLDGRIATRSGLSQWLSGAEDLLHTHRMRALFDAVVVGCNTVEQDDPQLTVRHCTGPNPVRVVIDPARRLDGRQRVFRDGVAPTLVLVGADTSGGTTLGEAEILRLPRTPSGFDPHEIRRALAARGLQRLFVEGGGITVSRFLAARALDRLQLTVAPILLGSGRPSVLLPEVAHLSECLRPPTRRFTLGDDVMFECDFGG